MQNKQTHKYEWKFEIEIVHRSYKAILMKCQEDDCVSNAYVHKHSIICAAQIHTNTHTVHLRCGA